MKKIITTASVILFFMSCLTITAQNIIPCNTYEMQEYYKKTIPGYAEKLLEVTRQSKNDFLNHLNGLSSQKTNSLSPSYTFTIPVVFHILHTNGIENISDASCIAALDQVNKDYARLGSDTNAIDPLFKNLYVNSNFVFKLAQKDPNGNCTSGIVHHYDVNTEWDRKETNFKYSNRYLPNTWHSNKYLNIYIVKNIIGQSAGTIIGYTFLPGTSLTTSSDAIVYRYDFLSGTSARSLSHEIGHWFGLSHTFGDSNNAGISCGNDDIFDTPQTAGFFSTCPKVNNLSFTPNVLNLQDSSEIVNVSFGTFKSITTLNSLKSILTIPTTTTVLTKTITAKGIIGGYTDFTKSYPLEIAYNTISLNPIPSATINLSVKSLASYTDSNSIGVYIDLNNNGVYNDAGEAVFVPTVAVLGTNTFNSQIIFPPNVKGHYRMRIITNKGVVTNPLMSLNSGEVEDYLLAIRLTSCDSLRPNIENIMDYSSCPKMFTQGQTTKIRFTANSSIADRNMLSDTTNLVSTGLFNTSSVVNCPPVADFYANKIISCSGQSVTYNSTSYNSAPTSFNWAFEGGVPATSSSSNPIVNYPNPGLFSTTLTVSNSFGTNTIVKNPFLNNNWNSNDPVYPYTEDFENGLTNGWTSKNMDYLSVEWQSSNYGSQNTKKSMVLPNYDGNYYDKNIDILESPTYNFHNVSNIVISIDYCAPRKANTGVLGNLKSLYFQYSTDCGGTWLNMPVNFPTDSIMATYSGVTSTAPYIPWDASKWKTLTNSSAALAVLIANKRDVKFRFLYKNSYASAQHLYLDQFSISATIGLEDFANNINLSLYPNPTSESTTLEFTSPIDSKAIITVNDILGRQIENANVNVNAGIMVKHAINSNTKLKAGIYFVTLNLGNQKVTKKLIIE